MDTDVLVSTHLHILIFNCRQPHETHSWQPHKVGHYGLHVCLFCHRCYWHLYTHCLYLSSAKCLHIFTVGRWQSSCWSNTASLLAVSSWCYPSAAPAVMSVRGCDRVHDPHLARHDPQIPLLPKSAQTSTIVNIVKTQWRMTCHWWLYLFRIVLPLFIDNEQENWSHQMWNDWVVLKWFLLTLRIMRLNHHMIMTDSWWQALCTFDRWTNQHYWLIWWVRELAMLFCSLFFTRFQFRRTSNEWRCLKWGLTRSLAWRKEWVKNKFVAFSIWRTSCSLGVGILLLADHWPAGSSKLKMHSRIFYSSPF